QAPATPAAPPAAAPAAQQEETSGRAERRRERRRADVLTREELVQSGTTNLLAAVERLRPQWLRPRGFTNFRGGGTAIVVYQGTTPLGGLDALRQLAPEFAEEMRFLDSSQASNTLPGLGSRAVAGAIVILRPGVNMP
ncbi:MAG TPA: hypothetical protein VK358_08530, partial [Longimicrobium sp.]|nr:hypothetical protein [Longimicrobium sp.]